ncbi:MAG: hypothetical protein HXY50_15275 [Ignavibacteriaceae bacterium]|nr:hypothetical protein [Ignavibacteriaceae bacterium]
MLLLALLTICSYFIFPQQSKLSKSVNIISEYIASEAFITLKTEIGDLKAADSIYIQSINNSSGDYSEALLALTFATVPYKEVPIQIPLLNTIINYPLISASDSIFSVKNKNLPRYIFFDSPGDSYGDKDKLAHFFGSAYISFASNIFDLGNPIGYFVEVFEESFKVQSFVDDRDLMTNQLGNTFGSLLKLNKNIMPSQILILRTLTNFSFNL